jgi:hypothetical protein
MTARKHDGAREDAGANLGRGCYVTLRCFIFGHDHRNRYGAPVGPCTRCGKILWHRVVGSLGFNYLPPVDEPPTEQIPGAGHPTC